MTRSQELFELLSRRSNVRERETARAPAPAVVKPKDVTPAARPRKKAVAQRAEAAAVPRTDTARSDAIVLSRRSAALLAVTVILLVAVSFLAGERVGRAGGLGLAPISSLAPGGSAPAESSAAQPVAETQRPVPPDESEATYGIRVVTYEFTRANSDRATEMRDYFLSLGFPDVEARLGRNGTEIRLYVGRYSRPDDPALKSMLERVKALPGDGKGRDKLPFGSAYIMPLQTSTRGE